MGLGSILSRRKNPAVLLSGLLIVSYLALFLSGCAVLPIRTSPTYYLEDLYKRISYKTAGRYRVVDIFYATCRQVDYAALPPAAFKNELAGETTYGTLDIRIDPRLRIGSVLPEQLKKNGVIELRKVENLGADDFMKKLSEAVKASPHKSLLVLIFGYKDGFEATAVKAAYFSYLLDVNTPVLLFDWPGDQPVGIAGYMKAQSEATASGRHLADVLARIHCEVGPEKLWIEASSLGCQVLCDAFDSLSKHPHLCDSQTEIDHVILAAPDVGRDEFIAKFKDELSVLSKKLTAYVSSDDDALLMSGIINRDDRLGRVKSGLKEPEQLEEARGLLYLKSMDPERFMIVDVTPINNASFKHGYYLECPEFYDDFYMRIFGIQPNANRRLYLLKFKGDTDYWVLQGSK